MHSVVSESDGEGGRGREGEGGRELEGGREGEPSFQKQVVLPMATMDNKAS